MQQTPNPPHREAISKLTIWFSTHQRDLPWRRNRTPYGTWLCEIIMQQTRIDQGLMYWHRFMEQFPDVKSLAAADEAEVLKAWQGLGYYSRARNLHRAAGVVSKELGGSFPATSEGLRRLPGVGPYTAAAVASMCFGEPVVAVDGNVNRVIARFMGIDQPVNRPEGRRAVEAAAEALLDSANPGNHNEAMMELGALVCTPRTPRCTECPLAGGCASAGDPEAWGRRPSKAGKARVEDVSVVGHVLTDGDRVAVRRRPETGIWGGLWEFPSTWIEGAREGNAATPIVGAAEWLAEVRLERAHVLSHRRLWGRWGVWKVSGPGADWGADWEWVDWEEAQAKAWPRMTERAWPDLLDAVDSL